MVDRFKAFVRSLLARRRLDEDMDDELRFHIEQYQRDLLAAGMPPLEAERRARCEFGNIGLVKEECRDAVVIAMFGEIGRNVRYAFRQLRRSPGFAAVTVLTLGLCIAAGTIAFSIIDAALLRVLPYPEPGRLGEIVLTVTQGAESETSMAQDGYAWEALKDARSFRVAAAGTMGGVNLNAGNRACHVEQHRVSAGYFRVLGIPLAYGREFDSAEDRDGGPSAVVLSHGIWKRLLGGDASIVGRTVQLRGEPYVVVGITAEGFRQRGTADLWTPLKPSSRGEGAGANYTLIARLNPGATWAQARAEAQARGAAVFEARKLPPAIQARMDLAPFDRASQAALRDRLIILGATAGIVLLIGCVNIASLMLARGSGRRREMGTRVALGGGPGSLMRQLTTESLVLGLLGGAAGLALGYAGVQALQTVVARFGVWQELRLDLRVLAMTAFISLCVSLLFGLAPALQAARSDVREALLEAGSRTVAGIRSRWWLRSLVVTEVALCLVLVVGAGLLIRTLLYLQNLDPGFNATNVYAATASLQDARYNESHAVNRLFRDSLETIRRISGVEVAAVGLHVPYQRWLNGGVKVRGGPGSDESLVGTTVNYVTPGYFDVLRIPLRAGRIIDERDTIASTPVVLVNERFVRVYLNGRDALSGYIATAGANLQIVGVVGDLQQQPGLRRSGPISTEPAIYLPAAQCPSGVFRTAHTWYSPHWVVRSASRRGEIAREIERAIAAADPLLPVASVHSMVDERDLALASERVNASLLSALAGLALLLALVGVYGVASRSVVERTREFGIRMALGSSVTGVIWNAVRPGVLLSVTGVVIGGALSLGAVRLLRGLLYGVQPADAPTFLIVSAALVGVSGLASLIPALSLARLAPANVLRQD